MVPLDPSSTATAEAPSINCSANLKMQSDSTKPHTIIEPSPAHESKSTQGANSIITYTDKVNFSSKGMPADDTTVTAPLIIITPQGQKAPQCSKCKRPRKGHPRSGCPFVDMLPLEINASVTFDSGGKHGMGSTPIEASDVEAAVVPPQDLMRNKASLSLSTSSEATAEQSPRPGVFHNEGNNVIIAPRTRSFQHPLEAAVTVTTSPSAENGTKNLISKLPIKPSSYNPITSSHIPPFASDFSVKQEPLSISSERSSNEQFGKPEEPEKVPDLGQAAEPRYRLRDLILQSASAAVNPDSFVLMLSGELKAVHAIFIIPGVNANAIVNQAAAVKFMTELAANNHKTDEHPKVVPMQIILGREEKTLQDFLSAVLTSSNTSNNPKVHLRGGLSALQTAVVAALIGAIGVWIAMAFA